MNEPKIDLKLDQRKLLDHKEEHEHDRSCCKKLQTLLFMVWDGAAAFNHNEVKLKRIQGKPPSWLDKLRTKDFIYSLLLFSLIYITVVHWEFEKFGTEKTVKYEQIDYNNHNFTMRDNLPLMAWTYYNVSQTIAHINVER